MKKTLSLLHESQLDWKFLSREKFKYTNEKESLKINYCCFFPSFTLTGFTSSFLVGAQSKKYLKQILFLFHI